MTITDMIRRIQALYGSYNQTQADTMRTYLVKQGYSERYLDKLWAELTRTTDTAYSYKPTVACLEKIAARLADDPPAGAPPGTLQIEDGTEDRKDEVAECFARLREKLGLRPWRE